MKLKFKPIGRYIRLIDERNKNAAIGRLLGINISKNFMPSVANVSGTDLSKYKIIRKGQFATNVMHVGRDERLPIALYDDDDPAIVSPAYKTFEVIDESLVLPEFLMIFFQRGELDRLAWFFCDSSIRGGLDWERFCEIEIPMPHPDEQRKYVSIYTALRENQKCYDKSLEDLRLICDAYLESQLKKGNSQKLGPYIRQTEDRNHDLAVNNLLGISVSKKFIPSRAYRKDLNTAGYKVVRDQQFGYVSVTSRNGEKISIALLKGSDGVISSTYVAFEIIDTKFLLPEYLFLWVSRPEFDRYARFHSWGSARETFRLV